MCSVLVRPSCALLVAVLAAAAAAQVGARQEPPRPTLVRVVGPDGRPRAGAEVVFFSAPLGPSCPFYEPRIVRAETDRRGRVRVRVAPWRVWSVWAAWDGKDGRLASDVVAFPVPGRPLRLALRPFAVSQVRWKGLGPWRKRFGDDLACAFLSELPPFAAFRTELPAGDEPAMRIPPLPFGNYFATLTTRAGAFLDARYFSPAFLEQNPPEELYERDVPLKRIQLGKPVPTRLELRDPKGRPVSGAGVFVRPAYDTMHYERSLVANDAGDVDLVLPWRTEGGRGWFTIRLLVVAPGFLPYVKTLAKPVAEAGPPLELHLTPGTETLWRLGAGKEREAAGERLYLRTRFTGEASGEVRDAVVPVPVRADGSLGLPSPIRTPQPRPAGSPVDVAPWQLFLVRDGVPALLFDAGTTGVPPRLEVGRGNLVDVRVHLVHAGGKAVLGGRVHLCRRVFGSAVSSVPYAVDRAGTCRLRLMPGRHLLYCVTPRRGDALRWVDVPAGPTFEARVELAPFVTLDGRTVDADGEPFAGATVQPLAVVEGVAPALFQSWQQSLARPKVTAATGRFRLQVSKLARRVDISASRQDGSEWRWGNVQVDPAKQRTFEIVMQQ